jgi:hypothetical protein
MKKVLVYHKKRIGSAFLCKDPDNGRRPNMTVVLSSNPIELDERIVEQYPHFFRVADEILAAEPALVSDSEEVEDEIDAEEPDEEIEAPVADDVAVAPVVEADKVDDLDALQEEAEALNELYAKIASTRGKKKLDELAAQYKIALDRTKSVKEMKADFLDALAEL